MRKPLASFLPLVAVVAMLGLACASLFGFVPITPTGVQCPTAAVQTVTVRDCCGHLVTRAPKPGEKAFLQCRCAEKKGAAHEATVPAKINLFLDTRSSLLEVVDRLHVYEVPRFAATLPSVVVPPALRPPTVS